MRTKTAVEILEDAAREVDSINVKIKIIVAMAMVKKMESDRVDMRYRQIAVLKGIKELALRHYDPEADFGDVSLDDRMAHINARIVFECDQALRELWFN
jgi:hypothetical protein